MRIFIAGATGVLGSRLVPELARRMADALDPRAVAAAVARAEPEVVVHQLTALSEVDWAMRNIDRAFAMTNRLRTQGTDNLLAAARSAGADRFLAQSFAGWPYVREGGPVKDEDARLAPDPPAKLRRTLGAIRHLEKATLGADGIEGTVLRYGGFYGPGTTIAHDGAHAEAVRRRRFPIVGDGGGVWSLVHVDDAAAATMAAIERRATGIYNIVDDEPARISEWIPALADAVGAQAPRRVPRWLGRLAAGDAAVTMVTEVRGASNSRARSELGWELRYPSWRQGFLEGLD